ncbi:aromatic ring-hydroxylating oxygenase subunit alpha [Ekhidna sp.]|uniref:aromatic ring-hydroxylating oxygenase subunit alpha n=1 Tax=Ekhidna sp. TaxID=2608089 RepID=UPI003CCC3437
MSAPKYTINPNITAAETLPGSFYQDQGTFDLIREQVFYQSWQWVGDEHLVKLPKQTHPFVLFDGFLTEPLVLTKDESGSIHCLSNVCTHRGNLVAQNPGSQRKLMCMYHGRKFGLDGSFESMPEFKEAQNFPRDCEDLHRFDVAQWGPMLFANLGSKVDFNQVIDDMNNYVGFLPLEEFVYSEVQSKDYLVNAHWALYCDNYLEGFHIPFVHSDLNETLDYGSYETVLHEHFNVQVGYSEGSEDIFDLPKGHVHQGKRVAAYYFWVFPNMMFNFYPWGLSVNIVRPISLNQTKVSFLSYIYDESKLHKGAGALLDKVEREDEFVVEGVHKGLKSRYYSSGRFSPTRETGVHQFHQMLAKSLS